MHPEITRFASIDVVQDVVAACLINGHFQTKKITNLRAKTSLLETADWLPQEDRRLIEELKRRQREGVTELDLNIQETHRQRRETTITKVGALETLEDVEKVFYNLKILCAIICNMPAMKAAKSLPVLDQLMDFYAKMTGCSDFKDWLTETGGGACLPQSVFQKLDTTNLNLKVHASNFLNYNRANGGVAAADIDNKFQLRALTTAKNAKKYFDNLIADSQPDKSVPAIVQYARVPELVDGSKQPAPAQQQPPPRPREEDSAPEPRNPKKPKRRVLQPGAPAGPAASGDRKKLGMFIPVDPNGIIVFPTGTGVCAGFTCRNQLCEHRGPGCRDGIHAFDAKRIVASKGMETLIAIADNFLRTGQGRFSRRHFKNVALPAKYNKLMIDGDAPSSA